MFRLTQIWATSKACWQTGVNLVVKLLTFTIDIDKQTAPLHKKIEKLQWQIDNAVLSEDQIREQKEQIAALKTQIENFSIQLTPLQVTKVVTTTHQ